MADSFVQHVASGSTDTFSVPFGYLDPSHVSVKVDGVSEDFTFPSTSQVQITSGNPAASAVVEVRRETPRASQEVVWQNAANLTASDLNTSDLQFLYITQEAFDTVANSITQDSTGNWDATNDRLKNLATPVDPSDAATKAYADSNIALTNADVVAAEDAKTAAETAESSCQLVLSQMQILYDDWDDRYLGSLASDPLLDNDGDALEDGTLYFNTSSNNLRVYDSGSASWLVFDAVIADNTITNAKLADDSVDTPELVDGAVTNSKVEDATLTIGKIAASALATVTDVKNKVVDKLVTSDKLGSQILNVSFASVDAGLSTTSNIPADNTIPQNTEGEEFLTVTHNAKSATSSFYIEVNAMVCASAASNTAAIALFRDSETDAIACNNVRIAGNGSMQTLKMLAKVSSLGTGNTTFKLRYGAAAGTMFLNRTLAATDIYGSAGYSCIKVTEIEE